jgi:hypothetical protein
MHDRVVQQGHRFGNMAAEVQNLSSILRLDFCAKLNICASISATSPSRKPSGCENTRFGGGFDAKNRILRTSEPLFLGSKLDG